MLAFVVVYGLDWVATVPPTSALATAHFGQQAGVVFAWIFAAHQLGAATAAWGAGLIRTHTGEYTVAFLAAGVLALVAAAAVLLIRSARSAPPVPAPVV
jgi:predicted MFS family arabinose efflux permease